jgi:hypothetical protein
LHLHIHNLSAFVKFHQKSICFVVCVKKIKTIMRNALFLELKFMFLHTLHDTPFFMQRFCGHIAREDVCVKILFYFLIFWNILNMYFKIYRVYASWSQNITP